MPQNREKENPYPKNISKSKYMVQITGCHRQTETIEKRQEECGSPQCPHTRRWQGREKGLKTEALTDIPKHKSQKKCEQRNNKKPGTQPQNYQRVARATGFMNR